jgi:ribose transport system substrate-binding protein
MKKKCVKLMCLVLGIVMVSAFAVYAGAEKKEPAPEEKPVTVKEPAKAPAKVPSKSYYTTDVELLGAIETRGPEGQVPIWYKALSLTEEEKDRIRKGNYTIGYCQICAGELNDVIGYSIEHVAKDLNMKYLWAFDDLSALNQRDNVESMLAAGADIICALSIDPQISGETFRMVAEQGKSICFLSNKAPMKWKEEYTGGLVFWDLAGLGPIMAEALNKEMGGEAKIGWVYHDANFFITNIRDDGFKNAIDKYPGMEIVYEAPWSGMEADAEDVANAMMLKHPEINAIYLPWQEALMPTISVLNSMGKKNVKIVLHDLNANAAMEMIKSDNVLMICQPASWDYGVAIALMGCYTLLGKELPAECVVVPGLGSTRDNLEEVWERCFNAPLPTNLKKELYARKK